MILIVGLGNPGKEYENTRHNVGFQVVENLAGKFFAAFIEESRFKAQTSAFDLDGMRVILAKPQTFMNNSGRSVKLLASFFKIAPENIIMVHDEIDLPLGTVRASKDAGAAGHNGVASVIEHLGSDLERVRVGIENRSEHRVPPTDAYVLQSFTAEEETKLKNEVIPAAVEKIEEFLRRK